MGRINLVFTVAMDAIRIGFANQSFKKIQQMINLSQWMVRAYSYKKNAPNFTSGRLIVTRLSSHGDYFFPRFCNQVDMV